MIGTHAILVRAIAQRYITLINPVADPGGKTPMYVSLQNHTSVVACLLGADRNQRSLRLQIRLSLLVDLPTRLQNFQL